MIDRNMKRKDLMEIATLSNSTISKLSKDEYVSMEVLVKICHALEVRIEDIIEIV